MLTQGTRSNGMRFNEWIVEFDIKKERRRKIEKTKNKKRLALTLYV